MRYGLNEEAVKAIQDVFRSHPAIQEVLLYGSRAKGNFKPGSDIDLTLVGDGIQTRELAKVEQELDDLLLPYTFGISLFRCLTHPGLVDHIRRVGVTFYRREDGREHPQARKV